MPRTAMALMLLGAISLVAVPRAQAQKKDPYKITAEEIAARSDLADASAYEVIRVLRPNFLRVRPTGSVGSTDRGGFATDNPEPALYIDDVRITSGLDELKNVRAGEIYEVRYMTSNAALARYGNGHEYGAIFVTTTAHKKP